jgi:predicted DCC family thiol-disulfide oxidoreductase YuxK
MSDRRPGVGRARLNVEADTYAAMCAALATELALVNPRARSLRALPSVLRDAVYLQAWVARHRAAWWKRAAWWVLWRLR